MDADPVVILLQRAANGALTGSSADAGLLHDCTAFLVEISHDRQRIREILRSMEQVGGGAGQPESPPFQAAALRALEGIAHGLLTRDPQTQSRLPADTQRLAAAVLAKKHAPEVFRVIAAQGDSRPANITRATGLNDVKVHRVLTWALTNGLLLRWAADSNVHYRLSGLGEAVLEAIDEPQWVSLAATLIRIAVRQELLDRNGDGWRVENADHPIARNASLLTGLVPEQAARILTEFSRALQPAAVSNLAASLRYTPHVPVHDETQIIIAPPVFHAPFEPFSKPTATHGVIRREQLWAPRLDSLAESLVVRTVERAGIPSRHLREVLPHHYLRATKQERPYHLPCERPIITIGGPELNPVTAGLFFEYGVSVHLRARPTPQVLWQEGNTSQPLQPSQDNDYGLLLRIFDENTGVTHFILGGLRPSGTYGACRYFFRRSEELLEQFPEQSFAAVMRVPRSYARRKQQQPELVVAPQPVETSANRYERLDMRYVEILPLLAQTLLAPLRSPLQRQLFEVLNSVAHDPHRGTELQVLGRGALDAHAPVCRRVRDVAEIYTRGGRMDELVALVAEEAAGGGGRGPQARAVADRLWSAEGQELTQILRDKAGFSKFGAVSVAKVIARRRRSMAFAGELAHGAPA